MEDKQIIDMLFQRAETAIETLTQVFGNRLIAMANNILADPRDVQECVNDTYLALWNTIPPQRPEPLWAYVCRVGKNICCKRLRSNRAEKRNSEYHLSLDELAGCLGEAAMERQIEARELGRAIDEFLSTLGRQNRILFVRRHWFGDSVRSIARQTGLSENTVSVRLSRIRNQLRNYLIKEELIDG